MRLALAIVPWLLAVFAPASPLPLWSFSGHRVACEIAFQELRPGAREEVRRLTTAFGRYDTFSQSCVWADLDEAKAIHYAHWVNLPPQSPAVTMEHCPEDCVLRHLTTELEILRDPQQPDDARARALMFVGHFVGDIHQPLHIAYASDRGGNGHRIVDAWGDTTNLHSVWDGRILSAGVMADERAGARRLHGDINPIDRTVWASLDPLVWANESYRLVEDVVYDRLEGPNGERLGDLYLERNAVVVEVQLKKAGVRLGAMLNAALGGGG